AGMSALAFAMDRHSEALTQRREVPQRQRRLLRAAGMALLAVSLVPCLRSWGVSVGAVAWLGFLSAGALLIALLLPYRPRVAALAAAVAAALALLLLAVPCLA